MVLMAYGRKVPLKTPPDHAQFIQSLTHPPQSPDPTPIEARRTSSSKGRVKTGRKSVEELKRGLQAEWAALLQEKVQI